MLPLFKSHYSIGKSILTLNEPGETDSESADSIFDLLINNKINDLTLVENSPTGFLQAQKVSDFSGINFVFGLIFNMQCSLDSKDDEHKIIVFARSKEGCNKLNLLYSDTHCNNQGVCTNDLISQHWSDKHLLLAIPFYDSFLYKNNFSFSTCMPNFDFAKPIFFIENNNLPIDNLLEDSVNQYCSNHSLQTLKTKTILYNKKSDVEAFQTYKCICNRNFSRQSTLSNPNLSGFGSSDFSFESYLSEIQS
jgi:DNA polymerase III alpha subunit